MPAVKERAHTNVFSEVESFSRCSTSSEVSFGIKGISLAPSAVSVRSTSIFAMAETQSSCSTNAFCEG